jgi:hypothetical protein
VNVLKNSVEPSGGCDGGHLEIKTIASDYGVRAAFLRPQYLPRSAWLEHIPFAFWLVSQHKPRMIVELGTHYGASYFAFCQAIEALSLDTRCYAVDTWQGDEHAGLYGEDVFSSVSFHNNAFYSRFSSLIRASFKDTAPYFDDGSIDLLHIDGLHTEDAVRNDVETWLPKLSDRAVMLLHDVNVREREFGVAAVLKELRNQYPVFEFAHGHGLGVIGVGKIQHVSVRALLDAEAHMAARRDVMNFFARLGCACSDAYLVQKVEQERAAKFAARSPS